MGFLRGPLLSSGGKKKQYYTHRPGSRTNQVQTPSTVPAPSVAMFKWLNKLLSTENDVVQSALLPTPPGGSHSPSQILFSETTPGQIRFVSGRMSLINLDPHQSQPNVSLQSK